jgi:hypothetical protein
MGRNESFNRYHRQQGLYIYIRTSFANLGFQRFWSPIMGHSSTIIRWRNNVKVFISTIDSLQCLTIRRMTWLNLPIGLCLNGLKKKITEAKLKLTKLLNGI